MSTVARYAEMDGATCTNVVLADAEFAAARGLLGPIPAFVGPGWTTTNGGATWTSGTLPLSPGDVARGDRRARMDAARAKARAILADPAGSADWTAGERKVLLAVLLLDLLGD